MDRIGFAPASSRACPGTVLDKTPRSSRVRLAKLKRSTRGPHGHRVTLTAAPSIPRGTPRGMRSPGPDPGPVSTRSCRNRKEPECVSTRPPGHDRQCSALSDRRRTSPLPDGRASMLDLAGGQACDHKLTVQLGAWCKANGEGRPTRAALLIDKANYLRVCTFAFQSCQHAGTDSIGSSRQTRRHSLAPQPNIAVRVMWQRG